MGQLQGEAHQNDGQVHLLAEAASDLPVLHHDDEVTLDLPHFGRQFRGQAALL